jgi:hypothetical protein
LKPSTVKATEKKATVWTPVVIDKNFPEFVEAKKLTYRGGDVLTKHEYPSYLNDVVGGLVLRLPLTEIREYLEH